jgi:hypothetical protein
VPRVIKRIKSVYFQDASLPVYDLGSRGIELREALELAVSRIIEKRW